MLPGGLGHTGYCRSAMRPPSIYPNGINGISTGRLNPITTVHSKPSIRLTAKTTVSHLRYSAGQARLTAFLRTLRRLHTPLSSLYRPAMTSTKSQLNSPKCTPDNPRTIPEFPRICLKSRSPCASVSPQLVLRSPAISCFLSVPHQACVGPTLSSPREVEAHVWST